MLTITGHQETADGVLFDAAAAVEERRTAHRLCSKVSIRLTAIGCCEGHPCLVQDISEDGLYVLVPQEHGLVVGMRLEVIFADDAESPAPAALAGETCYATVVRTVTLLSDAPHMVGAGLRFDQPLFF